MAPTDLQKLMEKMECPTCMGIIMASAVEQVEVECYRCGSQMEEQNWRGHQRVCPQGIRKDREALLLLVPGRYTQAISREGRGRALARQAATIPGSVRPGPARPSLGRSGPAGRGAPRSNRPVGNPFVAQGP